MTWHDDRDGVAPVGEPDGADGGGVAQSAGDVGVGAGATDGDLQKPAPHGELELRAPQVERHGERREPAGEVAVELVAEDVEVLAGGGVGFVGLEVAAEPNRGNAAGRRLQAEGAEGGGEQTCGEQWWRFTGYSGTHSLSSFG